MLSAKITIKIYGGKYYITTSEDPDYVQSLAREMDKEVLSFMARERGASLHQALVLMALSYLDLYKKSENAADNLRAQISGYLEEASAARAEADKARAEVTKARQESDKAQAQLSKLREESEKIYSELGEALRRIEQLEREQPIASIRTQ